MAAPAGAGAPLTGSKIIAKLNAERAKLGMYSQVQLNASWSGMCAKHNHWMKINGRVQHPEPRGSRGYSKAGNWAGTNSVLSGGLGGWRTGNPWINAPIHLSQTYHPRLRVAGASDASGYSCLTSWPGILRAEEVTPPAVQQDHVFTLPRDGGRTPFSQFAMESPFVPQEKVGIRGGRRTGPYLYVWSYTDERAIPQDSGEATFDEWGNITFPEPPPAELAPLWKLTSGSLKTASGSSVKVKVIDDSTIGGYVGSGNGWLLPVHPLKKNTTYKASVTIETDRRLPAESLRTITHTWTFKTTRSRLGL